MTTTKRPTTSQGNQINSQTAESTKLYNADQAQGADYFRPQSPLKTDPTKDSGDIDASSVPGSKPARNQKRKPE